MPVSLNQYRGEIGRFYNQLTCQIIVLTISLYIIYIIYIYLYIYYIEYILYITHIIFLYILYWVFLNILVNFAENVSVYNILTVNTIFLMFLNTFSSCNIFIYEILWHIFLTLCSWQAFWKIYGKVWFTYTMWWYWIEFRSQA